MTNIMFDAIRDAALHTGIAESIIERVFSRLILEEPFAYAFGMRPDELSREEMQEEIDEKQALIDDASAKLAEILYDPNGYTRTLKKVLTLDDKEKLKKVERSLS